MSQGNILAIRPGKQDRPPTFVGSHLDTQPNGGRYDGILGVCAGVEMMRVLKENDVHTERPVGVVNWTNEEGARFPISMVSSGGKCFSERFLSILGRFLEALSVLKRYVRCVCKRFKYYPNNNFPMKSSLESDVCFW